MTFIGFMGKSIINLVSDFEKPENYNIINYCKIGETSYEIEFDSNKYFNCKNCSSEMNSEIKNLIDFDDLDVSMENINNYFSSHNGSCE